jgi:hypothetical protein
MVEPLVTESENLDLLETPTISSDNAITPGPLGVLPPNLGPLWMPSANMGPYQPIAVFPGVLSVPAIPGGPLEGYPIMGPLASATNPFAQLMAAPNSAIQPVSTTSMLPRMEKLFSSAATLTDGFVGDTGGHENNHSSGPEDLRNQSVQVIGLPMPAPPFVRSVNNPLRKLSYDLIKTYKQINEVRIPREKRACCWALLSRRRLLNFLFDSDGTYTASVSCSWSISQINWCVIFQKIPFFNVERILMLITVTKVENIHRWCLCSINNFILMWMVRKIEDTQFTIS